MNDELANYVLVHPSGFEVEGNVAPHVPLLQSDLPCDWQRLGGEEEDEKCVIWWRKMIVWLHREGAARLQANVWSNVDPNLFVARGFESIGKFCWEATISDEIDTEFLLYIGFSEISIRDRLNRPLALIIDAWDGFLLRVRGSQPTLSLAQYREQVLR